MLRAVAVRYANDTFQLELSDTDDDSQPPIVYINGVRVVESPPLKILSNMYVYSDTVDDAGVFTFFLQLPNTVSVELKTSVRDGALSLLLASIPPDLGTVGLLGTAGNGFVLPNGTQLEGVDPDNDRQVFSAFGEQWRTTAAESVFTYADGLTHASFNSDLLFTPSFLVSEDIASASSVPGANETCQGDRRCLFDVAQTGQLAIGALTVQLNKAVRQIRQRVGRAARTCVRLSKYFHNGQVELIEADEAGDENAGSRLVYRFRCDPGAALNTVMDRVTCVNGTFDRELPKYIAKSGSRTPVQHQQLTLLTVLSSAPFLLFFLFN